MSLRRHTIVAALVIASFVALQSIWFLANYEQDGMIKTENQAIVAAHDRCFPWEDGPWRAVLRRGVWLVHAEWYRGLLGEVFGGYAQIDIDARTGQTLSCRQGSID